MSSLISSVCWIKRGVAAQNPSKYVLDDKELERVSALARIELEDARIELERAHEAAKTMGMDAETDDNDEEEGPWVDEDEDGDISMHQDPAPKKSQDDLSEYHLENYDDDSKATPLGPFSNIKGLTYYRNNEEDPYITLKDAIQEEEDEERAELEVLPTDNLLVTAKTADEISQLEIYVYDASEDNLYAHHDLMLPNFPLCLEWLDFPPSSGSAGEMQTQNGFGNYIAVGTLDPEIEIWSLDVIDAMYPHTILGRPDKTNAHVPTPLGTGKKKRKKTKHRTVSAAHHVDAVLALSWNKTHRNLLVSASADRTVKLWDLSRTTSTGDGGQGATGGEAIRSWEDIHKDKVQAVQWNPSEPTVLLTGSYDRTVRTFDSRAPGSGVGALLGADVEALRWDPWEAHNFYVSLENGLVLAFDARALPTNPTSSSSAPASALFTLAAHDGAAAALDVNPHIRGCLVTGGTDRLVKIWNIVDKNDNGVARNVTLVGGRDLGVGKVFSAVFSPDDALTVAAAGSKAKVQIWDVGANSAARKVFGTKLKEAGKVLREKENEIVGVVSDEEETDDEED